MQVSFCLASNLPCYQTRIRDRITLVFSILSHQGNEIFLADIMIKD